MNKLMDGFWAGGDSFKPLRLSSDMRHSASLSFVNDQVIIRPLRGSKLTDAEGNELASVTFSIHPEGALPAESEPPVLDAEANSVSGN